MISYLKCKKLKFHLLFFYASLSTPRLFFQQSLNHFFPCRYESLLKTEDEKLKGILTSRQWLGARQVPREPSTLRPHVLTQYPDIALQTTSDLKMKTALITFQIGLAAAAKSLQSCPTLCDPIDGSPPGSPVPEILQARTLEWVAISFSNAWKWKAKVKSLSRARLLATPWTGAYQLLCPWDFPGKSTGVWCHCLLCQIGPDMCIFFKNTYSIQQSKESKL